MFNKQPTEIDKGTIHVKDIKQLEQELLDQGTVNTYSTDLTPHELYLLRQNGQEPVGFVVGVIVYSMGLRGIVRSFMRAFTRGEMIDFSHLNEVARDIAIKRMQTKANTLGASGVVGVHLSTREYADFIEVIATGTAVKQTSQPSTKEVVVGV
jgi:uncharacterized protein YbjQ (UPF0145 family)